MKDLSLIARVGELADIGVSSLKIEGRLKGPEYVHTVSRAYREAVDAWAAGTTLDLREAHERLKDVFSRSNSDAPLAGSYGPEARLHRYDPALDRSPDAELVSCDRARGEAVVACRGEIRAGQGYAYSVGFHTGGFLVTRADRGRTPGSWKLAVRIAEHGPRLPPGLALFRNADHERKREAAAAMARVPVPAPEADTIAIDLTISGRVGEPLRVTAVAADGRRAEVASAALLQPAAKAPIDAAMIRDKLGAFGGTGFRCGDIAVAVAGACFLPASALKECRRVLVDALAAQPVTPRAEAIVATVAYAPPEPVPVAPRPTRIWVAVGGPDQARAALDAGADAAWLDDAALDLWSAAPPRLDAASFAPGTLWLRHPATAPLSPHLAAIGLPVVAGHLGVIAAARAVDLRVIADVFCNAFSTATLRALGGLGAEACVVSLECSSREIARLASRCAGIDAPQVAVIAAGRLPAMLTRQDHGLAIGATRSISAVARDGGLPYELTRRRHDTVIWEGRRLCAPGHISATAGVVDAWVLELADLPSSGVSDLVAAYRALANRTIDPTEVERRTLALAPHGLFTGHLHQGSRELDEVREEEGSPSSVLSSPSTAP